MTYIQLYLAYIPLDIVKLTFQEVVSGPFKKFHRILQQQMAPIKVVVCGGGNGAHVLAAISAAQPDIETRVFTLFEDEAKRWNENMPDAGITLEFHSPDKPTEIKVGKPKIVSVHASTSALCELMIFLHVF